MTHTQRPLVSDINSETWRLARTARAAQELRDYVLYGPQPPPAPAPTFTGPYHHSLPIPTSTPSLTWPPTPDFS